MQGNEEKSIKTLVDFGLTALQAKIYLILVRIDKSNARDLSDISKISRQDVYRLLVELLNLGFVEKIVSTPTEFRAIPIEQAISDLVNLRNEETIELQKEASDLLTHYIVKSTGKDTEKQESQLEIITEKRAQLLKTSKAFEETKNSIALLTKLPFLAYFIPFIISKKQKGDLNVRIITERPFTEDALSKQLCGLSKRNFFKIRYSSSPSCTLLLFDNREIALSLVHTQVIQGTPFLWSSNSSFTKVSEIYIQSAWEKAEEGK